VVDNTFLITVDGMLGNPFLKDNQVIIDMSKGEITSIENTIPVRSEMIISIQTNNQDWKNILIHAQKLIKNILCGNVLNTVKDQKI